MRCFNDGNDSVMLNRGDHDVRILHRGDFYVRLL